MTGVAAFGLRAPQNPAGFLIASGLSATALFAIGLWIAAIARTGRAGGAIGAPLPADVLRRPVGPAADKCPVLRRDISD